MAIAFVKSSVAGRSAGKSATAMAAYRSGSIIIDRASGKVHDYTKKQGVDHSEILSPIATTDKNEWLTDRAELWNRVEAGEKRYDAQLTREIVIAIPRELDRENQIALVKEYIQSSFVDRGMVADLNLHHLDGDNPHAHVMLTMRELKIDEKGDVSFGNKDRSWNDKKLYMKQKLEWDGLANGYLERAGFDVRIDSRSYEEQGIDRLPQIHLGVEVSQMRARNIPTDLGDKYDRIDWINNNIAAQFEEIYNAPEIDRDVENPLIIPQEISIAPVALALKDERAQAFKDLDLFLGIEPTEPIVKKWQHTMTQPSNLKLVISIVKIAQALDENSYQAGNYQVQIFPQKIEVEYKEKLAMVIDLSSGVPESKLVNLAHTINQYETGLGDSLDNLSTELERQREEEREEEKERELQRQLELQQELERQQQQLELEQELERQQQDVVIKFDHLFEEEDLEPSVDFGYLFPEQERERQQQDIGYSR